MDRPGLWRTAAKYLIQVFGRGNLRRSSWFENYLSIDPFWWINFNRDRATRSEAVSLLWRFHDRFECHNLRLAGRWWFQDYNSRDLFGCWCLDTDLVTRIKLIQTLTVEKYIMSFIFTVEPGSLVSVHISFQLSSPFKFAVLVHDALVWNEPDGFWSRKKW